MIINTGGRTDTVNYYSDWLLNRFEEGYVYSRNPLFPNHITKYTLDPSVVDCVVFCSKNYRPILPELHRITDRFNIFCHLLYIQHNIMLIIRVKAHLLLIVGNKIVTKKTKKSLCGGLHVQR